MLIGTWRGRRALDEVRSLLILRVPAPDPDDYKEFVYRRRRRVGRQQLGQARFDALTHLVMSVGLLVGGTTLLVIGVQQLAR
jgi:hypothetical protein